MSDIWWAFLFVCGVTLVAWALITPGLQLFPAFLGGFLVGLGIQGIVLRRLFR